MTRASGFLPQDWRTAIGLAVLAASVLIPIGRPVHAADAQATIDEFVASLKDDDSIDGKKREQILETVKRLQRDPRAQRMIITEALRTGWKDFDAANRDLGNERYEEAIKKLTPLVDARNRFLAAGARFLLARVYVMDERLEDAIELLQDLVDNRSKDGLLTADAMYTKALVEVRLLERDTAKESLQAFIDNFPDAPNRMRDAALRQLDDLENVDFGSLQDIHDRMDVSRRRLLKAESGKKTQKVQNEVVAMLSELIDEMEKKGGT